MRHATSLTKLLLLGSALLCASSCADKQPAADLQVPADLLVRKAEPVMTAEALVSEKLYEEQREAKIEWGRANAGIIDRACAYLKSSGVNLECSK